MKKRSLKVLTLFIMIIFAMALVVGCSGGANKEEPKKEEPKKEEARVETIVLKAAHTLVSDHPYHTGLVKFGELLKERTNGKYSVEVYPAAQLGSEREAIEGVQMGTIDITLVSTAPLAGFSDAFLVTDLPFIFTSREHAYKVLDGEIGKEMFSKLEGTGLVGLAFWENGFRNVTNSKRPIVNPEDMEGIKIRTMENQIHMDSFRVIGADPTPMAFGELFTALQQKTVDAQENPLPIIYTSKFFEVQDHLALTGHFYAPAPLLVSQALWDKLTDEEKQIFQKAAYDARDFERKIILEMDNNLLSELKAKGMQVTEPDKSKWQEAMTPVYEKWQDKIGKDLIEKVKAAAN
ncbi:MAG: TRAP-type transport system periplasmic protein [Clostridia bacterium]|jgi:tripartite ATP-independent transporter DctP family solute receptor|nr:TRAP-type transport system periplasmic protein [Clostridia bacterium]MDN5323672.1 TRAP-type transport system periplasmic protein [Clostridia bacterium]